MKHDQFNSSKKQDQLLSKLCLVGVCIIISYFWYVEQISSEPIETGKHTTQERVLYGETSSWSQITKSWASITKSNVRWGISENSKTPMTWQRNQNNSTTSSVKKELSNKPSTGNIRVRIAGFPIDSMATKIATFAYKISNWDVDFIALLKGENGMFTMDRRSMIIWANGHYDYGLCQINDWYHQDIVNDPRFKTSYEYQVEQCYKLYKWGTKFYAKPKIPSLRKYVIVEKI